MAEEKKEKVNPVTTFREKLRDKGALKHTLEEGLKSTNAKVRSLAVKWSHRTQDHAFVKKHVLPLVKNEKTKRVLASISKNVTRKEIWTRLEKFAHEKAKAAKETKSTGGEAAAPAAAPAATPAEPKA